MRFNVRALNLIILLFVLTPGAHAQEATKPWIEKVHHRMRIPHARADQLFVVVEQKFQALKKHYPKVDSPSVRQLCNLRPDLARGLPAHDVNYCTQLSCDPAKPEKLVKK